MSTSNPKVVVPKMSHQVLPILRKKCLLCETQYMVHPLLKEEWLCTVHLFAYGPAAAVTEQCKELECLQMALPLIT